MELVGVSNNQVNQGYGANWTIKSDSPINKRKYYFEVKVTNASQYSSGAIGYSYFGTRGGNGFQYANSMVFDAVDRSITYTDPQFAIKSTALPGQLVNSIIGLGIALKGNDAALDVFIDGKKASSLEVVNANLDPTKLYVGTYSGWNHNAQTAQYYFDNDVTYKDIAGLYIELPLYNDNGKVYGVV